MWVEGGIEGERGKEKEAGMAHVWSEPDRGFG